MISKLQAQAEAELALILRGAGNHEKIARGDAGGGRAEMRRVGEVVGFGAELEQEALLEREGAEQAEVGIENAGGAEDVAAGVAEADVADGRKGVGIVIGMAGSDAAEFGDGGKDLIGGLGVVGRVERSA